MKISKEVQAVLDDPYYHRESKEVLMEPWDLNDLIEERQKEAIRLGEMFQYLSDDANVDMGPLPLLKERLRESLALLTEMELKVIELRYWKNLKMSEIAEYLGVKRDSIRRFLNHALDKLRNLILAAITECRNVTSPIPATL